MTNLGLFAAVGFCPPRPANRKQLLGGSNMRNFTAEQIVEEVLQARDESISSGEIEKHESFSITFTRSTGEAIVAQAVELLREKGHNASVKPVENWLMVTISPKYADWVEAIEPQTVKLTLDQIHAAAQKLGWRIHMTKAAIELKQNLRVKLSIALPLRATVEWSNKFNQGPTNQLTYEPYIWGANSSDSAFTEQFLEALGYQTLIIPTPEQVVHVPAPTYAIPVGDNGFDGTFLFNRMFFSEAQAAVTAYVDQLKQMGFSIE